LVRHSLGTLHPRPLPVASGQLRPFSRRRHGFERRGTADRVRRRVAVDRLAPRFFAKLGPERLGELEVVEPH
jgi:hypothetical protein